MASPIRNAIGFVMNAAAPVGAPASGEVGAAVVDNDAVGFAATRTATGGSAGATSPWDS